MNGVMAEVFVTCKALPLVATRDTDCEWKGMFPGPTALTVTVPDPALEAVPILTFTVADGDAAPSVIVSAGCRVLGSVNTQGLLLTAGGTTQEKVTVPE